MRQIKVIITGTTGMVGEGVLMSCLSDSRIAEVLSVSRRSSGKSHPKLKEYIINDFLSMKEGDHRLAGYDACFFCAGVSSIGMSEADYTRMTYETTLRFAKIVSCRHPVRAADRARGRRAIAVGLATAAAGVICFHSG